MKIILFLWILFFPFYVDAQEFSGKWITAEGCENRPNTWLRFAKNVCLKKSPRNVVTRIAADTKYWLWINDTLVIFEGGVKRGPTPEDTYYDRLDLTRYLRKGDNRIEILLWYFGKNGFAHKSSGKAGLLFDCRGRGFRIISDESWYAAVDTAYGNTSGPFPNYRLAESNIRYDARIGLDFVKINTPAVVLGKAGDAPWNCLYDRQIPQWKNFGMKEYVRTERKDGLEQDTIVCVLPYNMQMTPWLEVEAAPGRTIGIYTDNTFSAGAVNLRAEYVTKAGRQAYESLGWLNGHRVYYVIPHEVKILGLKYRETGYDTEFSGEFSCSDEFFNRFWEKARRTLYVTMRDNYMDCPERERAQWWGDVVNESGEAFYALSPSSRLLCRKGMYELIGWQRPDSSLFAPVPAGNWGKELPGQMLASVGYYGFWNYYLHTGDVEVLNDLYPGVRKYLRLWKTDSAGITAFRKGGWAWGDWGDNKDMRLIFTCWHYLALKGAALMADELDKKEDAREYREMMAGIKEAMNRTCWDGKEYRHPAYSGKTDDRIHALAVVAGIADPEYYPAIKEVFKKQWHSSPYMEKYVMEALFQMGETEFALERNRERFRYMVDHTDYTTLFEGWGIGSAGFGGGTVNHAWSGGTLTLLSQYLCGIQPLLPGYRLFAIHPSPGRMQEASAVVHSVAGRIKSGFRTENDLFILEVEIPRGTKAEVILPEGFRNNILVDGKIKKSYTFILSSGNYRITSWK